MISRTDPVFLWNNLLSIFLFRLPLTKIATLFGFAKRFCFYYLLSTLSCCGGQNKMPRIIW